MGEKLGYITSRDGTRENEASGTDVAFKFSDVEEVDAKYDVFEVDGPTKVSEYNGGGASSGIGDATIARELELIGEGDDRAWVSRPAPSVASRRSLAFSGGKIMSEPEVWESVLFA